MNPAIVPFHGSEASQMATHSPNHSRNSSHSFKEETPGNPLGLSHFLWIISRQIVIRLSYEFYGIVCHSVSQSIGLEMLVFDFLSLCQRIGIVRHSMTEGIVDPMVFGENLVKLFVGFKQNCFHLFFVGINFCQKNKMFYILRWFFIKNQNLKFIRKSKRKILKFIKKW